MTSFQDSGAAVVATDESITRAGMPSQAYVYYVVFLLFIVNIFHSMDRLALSVLMPSIKAELGLSDAELGLLSGFAFSIFFALCGIPIARWADTGIRRNIISLCLAVWSLMTALSGAAQSLWHLFAARVGVGAGEAGGLPPAQSLLCDYVPFDKRPGVFAIHMCGVTVGIMLGLALTGFLNDLIGWRWTFVALGLPGIALAILVQLTLREPRRGAFDPPKPTLPTATLRQTIHTLWRRPTFRLLVLYGAFSAFAQQGFIQWWPSFFSRVYDLPISSVGAYLGLAFGVGSGIGLFIGGFLGNRLAGRDPALPIKMGALAKLVSVVPVLGVLFAPSPLVAASLVFLTALLWFSASGPALASIYTVAPPHMRATAGAIIILASALLGSGLGPFIVGVLSDALSPSYGDEALRYALLAPTIITPITAIALYFAGRAFRRDLKAAA